MAERNISRDAVIDIVKRADVVKEYLDDVPFPSALFLGYDGTRLLHVVAALDVKTCVIYVITVYEPDEQRFEADFRTRKKT